MANTTNFNWETPDDTDLVKDGALAIRTLGNSIDTTLVDLKGGTTGQVLSKTSNTDMDFTWVTSDDANAIQNAIVDAKGDLIAASAADTPARLAVGNNGETLVADSSTSTGLRWQSAYNGNAFINGAFDVWQRGTSIAFGGSNKYGADRWMLVRSGYAAGATISRQTGNGNTQYAARVQRDSGNTDTSYIAIQNGLETNDSMRFAGKAVTISFSARVGANYSATSNNLLATLYSGTGTDQNLQSYTNGAVVGATQTFNPTTSWQSFQYTVTVPSTATELALFVQYFPTGTAGANDWFEITEVQLELGSKATTFKRAGLTLAGELAAAYRYYWRVTPGSSSLFGNGISYNTTSSLISIPYPVPMRIRPTALEQTGTASDYKTLRANAGAFDNCTAVPTFDGGTSANVALVAVTSANVVSGDAALLFSGSAGSYLGWSAEL